ncbi:peroxisome chaperone and import receptor [Zygosaccharomyces mellis]|uniref:Peroxisome chaperone and import receptor n=1 Tax=Zygosaccharomyces mellis TaxID=42258 RepID=A0A4C2E7I5_9SACH|nr:peroxisome chaperone and import receptor [Zygosaccharomyces mellis]
MSKNEVSSQAVGDQDYDELDDLLDEDPSKLEEPQERQESNENNTKTSSGSEIAPGGESKDLQNDDPEVKQMISDLEEEFGKLMNQGNLNSGNCDADSKQQENFKQILEMLNEASKDPQKSTGSDPTAPAMEAGGPTGFKNVVSKTLERLKENGSRVDHNIAQEQNKQDVFTQLLNELTSGEDAYSGGVGEDGVDDAILAILNQMSSKQVLYEPMKEMHTEFSKWLDVNGSKTNKDDLQKYHKQFELVENIVQVFEKPTYTDDHDRKEITQLLDQLEQLGDTPVSRAQNNQDQDALGAMDQELAQNCKQQ